MTTRFLLSHNYNITPDLAPPLSIEQFCIAFQTHLAQHLNPTPEHYWVNPITHPHWRCEVRVIGEPKSVGNALALALAEYRNLHHGPINYQILALGGLKTTPATSTSPDALQLGEWGVDVVETSSAEEFLTTLGWEKLIADKPETDIFQSTAS